MECYSFPSDQARLAAIAFAFIGCDSDSICHVQRGQVMKGERSIPSGYRHDNAVASSLFIEINVNLGKMTPEFDLNAYFNRIGYSGEQSPTLETLRAIHLRHTETIPFENLNPLLGWPVHLDTVSLQQKLVQNGRGGYCYEQNLLFRHALETMGFNVIGLAARVLWNIPEGTVLPRTHMLLRIDIDGQAYVADAGFGGLTLTAPLRLELDIEQSTPHEPFRLTADGAQFVLEAKLGDRWKSLYRFTLEEQLPADYEMANWYVSHHPKSRFVNGLMAARAAQDRRYALLNNEFTVHYLNGQSERRVLTTTAEIREVLSDPIGLTLPAAPELDAALQRLTLSPS
jgi:N-hydroxyarylamine O-acetyltransferase